MVYERRVPADPNNFKYYDANGGSGRALHARATLNLSL